MPCEYAISHEVFINTLIGSSKHTFILGSIEFFYLFEFTKLKKVNVLTKTVMFIKNNLTFFI